MPGAIRTCFLCGQWPLTSEDEDRSAPSSEDEDESAPLSVVTSDVSCIYTVL